MGPVSWGLWVGHSWQSLFIIKGICCPMGRPFNKSLGEQEVHLPTERLRWFWLGVSQLHVCLEIYQAHNFFSAKGPLSCSQSLPIHPWINLLADFWSSHLRNEFTWCYANPSISYSYISMNDYRSWARLIEFFPSSGTRQPHWVSLFHFASWCLEKAQPAGQRCCPVTAVTCWAMSPSFFTSSLLSWWGQWLPAALWNVFQMNSRHLESLTKGKLSCVWILGGTMVEGKKMVSGAKVPAEREELTGSDKNPISPTN